MDFQNILLFVVIFLVIDAIIVWRIFSKKKKISQLEKQKIVAHLQKIESFDLRTQLFEYDKTLDACLKALGKKGGTMGERMKNSNTLFLDTNAVWNAHKLRNLLAHELHFQATEQELKKAVQSLKREIMALLN